jgi:hypothetical protein
MYNSVGDEFVKELLRDVELKKVDINQVKDSEDNLPIVSVILHSSKDKKISYINQLILNGASPFIPTLAVNEELADLFAKFRPNNEIFVIKNQNFIQKAQLGFNIVYKEEESLIDILSEIKRCKLNIDNFYDSNYRPILHSAIFGKTDIEIIKTMLCVYKADPNSSDYYGRKPLTFAFLRQNEDIINLLFEYGANIDFASAIEEVNHKWIKAGASKLYGYQGKLFIDEVLTANVDLNKVADSHGLPVLIALLSAKDLSDDKKLELTEIILNRGYSLHKDPAFGILKYAIQHNYFKIVTLLLKHGSDASCVSESYLKYLNQQQYYTLSDSIKKAQEIQYSSDKKDSFEVIRSEEEELREQVTELKRRISDFTLENQYLRNQNTKLKSANKGLLHEIEEIKANTPKIIQIKPNVDLKNVVKHFNFDEPEFLIKPNIEVQRKFSWGETEESLVPEDSVSGYHVKSEFQVDLSGNLPESQGE